MTADRDANSDSIQYWNEDAGPRWARHAEAIDVQLRPFLAPLIETARLRPGQRVLDVGCGGGALTLAAAEAVAPGGEVVGVDVSKRLLDVARSRARDARGVVLREADAQTTRWVTPFDAAVSRFGVMFFEDSLAAFENVRLALAPGGRFAFTCWAAPEENPWMGIPREVVARHVELPAPDPAAPGPFRFSDPAATQRLGVESGFGDVVLLPLEGRLVLGGDGPLSRALDFLLEVGPAAHTKDAGEEVREAVRRDLAVALEPFAGRRGVEMPYRAWLFSAVA